jgi:prolipoprotein diacylglyceryltransferase
VALEMTKLYLKVAVLNRFIISGYNLTIKGVKPMPMFGGFWWLVGLIAAVWVIYDILANQKNMDSTKKLIWIICAVIFSIITAIVYYFFVKMKK